MTAHRRAQNSFWGVRKGLLEEIPSKWGPEERVGKGLWSMHEHRPENEKQNGLFRGTESTSMCLESRLEVSVRREVSDTKSVW